MVPLPEPVVVPVVPLYELSGRRTILEGTSGRLYVVEFDPGGPRLQSTAIALPDFLPPGSHDDYLLRQFAGDRLLVEHGGDVHVLSLTTGRALVSLSHMDHGGEAACLTPEGSLLFVVRANGDDFTAIFPLSDGESRTFDLNQPDHGFRTTMFTGTRDRALLDCPESALIVAVRGAEHRLLIGCFRYLVDWAVKLGAQPGDVQIEGEPRTLWGLAADPVHVNSLFVHPHHVFISGGYGNYLEAYNLETGLRSVCPWPHSKAVYGSIRGLIPGRGGSVLVRAHDAWIRWFPGGGKTEKICGLDFVLLGETEDGIWALNPNDPTGLLGLGG